MNSNPDFASVTIAISKTILWNFNLKYVNYKWWQYQRQNSGLTHIGPWGRMGQNGMEFWWKNVEKVKSNFVYEDNKEKKHNFIPYTRLPFGEDNWSFNKNRPTFDLMDQWGS